MLTAAGHNLKDFLVNLPNFHNRVILLYPELRPPEFKMVDVEDRSLKMHYFSEREGLQEFVVGLIQGLGKLYNEDVKIEILEHRDNGADHEVYGISW